MQLGTRQENLPTGTVHHRRPNASWLIHAEGSENKSRYAEYGPAHDGYYAGLGSNNSANSMRFLNRP